MATNSSIICRDVHVPTDIDDLAGFRRWVRSGQFPGEVRFTLNSLGDDDWIDVELDQEGYRHSKVLGRRFPLTRDRDRVGGYRNELHSREA